MQQGKFGGHKQQGQAFTSLLGAHKVLTRERIPPFIFFLCLETAFLVYIRARWKIGRVGVMSSSSLLLYYSQA